MPALQDLPEYRHRGGMRNSVRATSGRNIYGTCFPGRGLQAVVARIGHATNDIPDFASGCHCRRDAATVFDRIVLKLQTLRLRGPAIQPAVPLIHRIPT